jgi:hypothetical protein
MHRGTTIWPAAQNGSKSAKLAQEEENGKETTHSYLPWWRVSDQSERRPPPSFVSTTLSDSVEKTPAFNPDCDAT